MSENISRGFQISVICPAAAVFDNMLVCIKARISPQKIEKNKPTEDSTKVKKLIAYNTDQYYWTMFNDIFAMTQS